MARHKQRPRRKEAEGATREKEADQYLRGARSGPLRRTLRESGALAPLGPCKVPYPCPVCDGGNADATWTGDRWIISCWTPSCQDLGGSYLQELAEALGLPRGASKGEIAGALQRYAGPVRAAAPMAPLPTAAEIRAAQERLWADPNALRCLRGRGLDDQTIRAFRLGRSGDGITMPVYDAGQLVNVVTYRPNRKPKYMALAGRPAALYPRVPRRGGVVLGAGMRDPLVAWQARAVPVVTTTCGATLPSHLVPRLAGRPVAVAYDTGEEEAAERTVAALRAAGGRAWVVPLGLPEKGDDLSDWFVKYRRSARELSQLIRATRRAA